MPETETNPARPPRFPYVGALLCATCVGAAVWMWIRYSYCWELSAQEYHDYGGRSPLEEGRWPDECYVQIRVAGGRYRGRLEATGRATPVVDGTRGRFTGQSVAGLLLGTMGIFVFAAAIRHWLERRRPVRTSAES